MDSQSLDNNIDTLTQSLYQVALTQKGNSETLLILLRKLEQLHRSIREDLFVESLPDNRRELANLVRQIEEQGGWPYIERMRLRSLLVHLDWNTKTEEDSLEN